MRFVIISLKKLFFPICILIFILFLVIFSNDNLIAAKNGISLWATAVVPSLLPFFIATELLNYTNIISLLGKVFNKIMRPLFNVPGESAFALIMGILSGYPIGAKIASDLKSQGICTNVESERLLAFTNNSGPLFIVGTVGISLFRDAKTGILLLITHILSCITVGILFRWWKVKNEKNGDSSPFSHSVFFKKSPISISNLGEVFTICIVNSINTILLIGGFIVLFSVIISVLENSKILSLLSFLIFPILNVFTIPIKYSNGIISGIIELTNGVYSLSMITDKNISINIILCAFLLGFGGISIAMQVFSIVSKSKISIKPYLIGKLLQGTFASIYTFILIYTIPFFNLNL